MSSAFPQTNYQGDQSHFGSSIFGRGRGTQSGLSIVELMSMDPEDMFCRFSVAEIKGVAAKLRAEADAKQEDLRLMVGERYRDLLQTSTSIVDMSLSSERIVQNLKTIREGCDNAKTSTQFQQLHSKAEEDSQLKTLHSLSAHLKLLLDTPEHLWKLIERKKFLDAAWLFLLARVVHHALVGDESDEPGSWAEQQIDVMEQFPLVQRQWDSINPFRAQISHKATVFLREFPSQAESMAHAIIALVLLDSVSMTDALDIYLLQRTKALRLALKMPAKSKSWDKEAPRVDHLQPSQKHERRQIYKEFKAKLRDSINMMIETMIQALAVFSQDSGARVSAFSILKTMQVDAGPKPTVELSTDSLLSTLPSASLLALYLPEQIRNYVPFVDLASPQAMFPQEMLTSTLNTWFLDSSTRFNEAISRRMSLLDSVGNVNDLLQTLMHNPSLHMLDSEKQYSLKRLIEERCCARIKEIWQDTLNHLIQVFQESVIDALNQLECKNPSSNPDLDAYPTRYMLSSRLPYPVPGLFSHRHANMEASFAKFKAALKHRANNRTPLLDSVISNIENQAKNIHGNIETITAGSKALSSALLPVYDPLALESCQSLIDFLNQTLDNLSGQSKKQTLTDGIVFVGRIAHELSSPSPFLANMGLKSDALRECYGVAERIHMKSLKLWRTKAVEEILRKSDLFKLPGEVYLPPSPEIPAISQPSYPLITVLINLSDALYKLGLSRADMDTKSLIPEVLTTFIEEAVQRVDCSAVTWNEPSAQLLWDISFLELVSQQCGTSASLVSSISSLKQQMSVTRTAKDTQKVFSQIEASVKQTLPWTQLHLGLLLSCTKSSNDLGRNHTFIHGIPQTEYTPGVAVDQARPSPRIGLLPVGN